MADPDPLDPDRRHHPLDAEPTSHPGPLVAIRGRGASSNPPNRFERLAFEPDEAFHDPDDPEPWRETHYYRDTTKRALAQNDSPDVGFEYSLNPYRGCGHGCVYCYARPTHEYLGFSAGLDFETRIMVKEDAPELLRRELSSPKWKPQVIAMSGVTDPYQPAERRLRLTRRCLEVLAEFRNPVAIVTKGHLVTRDADLLAELAAHDAAKVYLSITSLDAGLQRKLEPRAASPQRRLDAIRTLSDAGVPTGVMVAPVVPGLTEHELPAIIAAAAEAGARSAGYITLRLPHGVKDLFATWLEQHFPDRRDKVLNRVRELRGGKLYDSTYGRRMRGEGVFAAQIGALYSAACRRAGLDASDRTRPGQLSAASFRVPTPPGGQIGLF